VRGTPPYTGPGPQGSPPLLLLLLLLLVFLPSLHLILMCNIAGTTLQAWYDSIKTVKIYTLPTPPKYESKGFTVVTKVSRFAFCGFICHKRFNGPEAYFMNLTDHC
jgi:hypothetical protein